MGEGGLEVIILWWKFYFSKNHRKTLNTLNDERCMNSISLIVFLY